MAILIVGASGATGSLVITELLNRGETVKAIVRKDSHLPNAVNQHERLTVITANITELSNEDIAKHIKDCSAVISCLGHRLSLKGIYGQPRRLVTNVARQLCQALKSTKPEKPIKYILMNTTGCSNRDIPEHSSFAEQCVLSVIRLLLPPHTDNEHALEFFRTNIGQNDREIEWVAVRPDSLVSETEVTEYEAHPSPIRSPLFNAGTTSRINVADFMATLITDAHSWTKWKGQMPVIYNKENK